MLQDTIADVRQQLDKLYGKKRSYGVFVARKKSEITEMVQQVCCMAIGASSLYFAAISVN